MDKSSDLLVDKSLHRLGSDWCDIFGHQFDFYDVINHIEPCNVGNRWRNMVFTTIGHSKWT